MMSASFPDSSSLTAATYQLSSARLRIVFRDGTCYDYLDVPSNIFSSLANAKSQGAFFNASIRDVYPAIRSASAMLFKWH